MKTTHIRTSDSPLGKRTYQRNPQWHLHNPALLGHVLLWRDVLWTGKKRASDAFMWEEQVCRPCGAETLTEIVAYKRRLLELLQAGRLQKIMLHFR